MLSKYQQLKNCMDYLFKPLLRKGDVWDLLVLGISSLWINRGARKEDLYDYQYNSLRFLNVDED